MKTLKIISLLLILASLFGACASDAYDKVLVRQEGTWNIDSISNEEYEDGIRIVSEVDESGGIYLFNRNKKGFYILGDGDTDEFTWDYDPEAGGLSITSDNYTFTFEVVEFTENSQTLRSEIIFFVGDSYITTIELSR